MDAEREIIELQVKIVELLENLEKEKSRAVGSPDRARNIVQLQSDIKKAQEDLTKSIKKMEESTGRFNKNLLAGAAAVGGFATSMASKSNTVSSSFTALIPAVKLSATAINGFAKFASIGVKGLAAAVAVLGRGAGTRFAGKIAAFGDAIGEKAGKAGDALTKSAEWYLESLEQVVRTTATLSKSGALSAGGIDHLAKTANNAGLSLEQLASVVTQQSRDLSFVYGTVATGIDTVAAASQQIKDSGEMLDLRKLGYAPEEIVDLMSQYATIQVMSGRRKELDDKKLRTGTLEYVKNLDVLARLTGQQRDAIAKQMEDITLEDRFGQFLETLGEGSQEQMKTFAVLASSKFGEDFGRAVREGAVGPGTEGYQDFVLATGGRGVEIMRSLQEGSITAGEAMRQMREALVATRQTLGGAESLSKLAALGTPLDKFMSAMRKAEAMQPLTEEEITAVKNAQKSLAESTTGSSANLAKASDAVQTMTLEINKLFIKSLPSASTAVDSFAQAAVLGTEVIIKGLEKLAGIDTTGGPSVSVPAPDWLAKILAKAGLAKLPPSSNVEIYPTDKRRSSSGKVGGGVTTRRSPILDLISQYESTSYGSLVYKVDPTTGKKYSGGEADLTGMTLSEVQKFQSGMRAKGHASTAVGKYQTVKDTLRGAASALGYDLETTKFTPAVQDAIGEYLIEQRRIAESKKKSPTTAGFAEGLGLDWEAFKTKPEAKAKLIEALEKNGMGFGNRGASVGPRNRYVPFNNSTLNPDDFNKAAPQGVASATTKNIPDLLSEQIDINRMQTIQLAELIDQSRKNNTGIENLIRVSVG